MKSLSSLKRQIDSLPSGNIYRKVIKGHEYWYLQSFFAGKRTSKLIPADEVAAYQEAIAKRKELEKQWKAATAAKNVTLSKTARSFTGSLMSGDAVVARFEEGVLLEMDDRRAPMMLKRTRSIEAFLASRVIDSSRTNARLLKKALNINESEDAFISLYAYGASLSDDFWFKPKHSKLKYADVRFDNDALADLALRGDVVLFPHKGKLTPELTTTGSFEKGWKRIDGKWWLYKNATKDEAFSELFCGEAAPLFGVPSIHYEYEKPYVRSQNFAQDINFEPMIGIAGDDDNYAHVLKCLDEQAPKCVEAYLRMVLFDAVVNNVDRHNENCGLLRSREDGAVLSLAPSFDCNLALLSRSKELNPNPTKDGFLKVFVEFLSSREGEPYKSLDYPKLNKTELEAVLQRIPKEIWPENIEQTLDAILIRYEYLLGIIQR